MDKIMDKMNRIEQVEGLLLANPGGLKQAEISRRLNISPPTISRYIREMSTKYPLFEEDNGLIRLDSKDYLNNITLNIHEALALSLAVNLVTDRLGFYNPYSVSALRKISKSMEKNSPIISKEIGDTAYRFEEQGSRENKNFVSHLKTLNQCWCENRIALVTHFSRRRKESVTYKLKIIKFRPYATGHSLHLIAYSIEEGHLRTLRVDRIEKVTPGHKASEMIVPGDINQKLKDAWDIWYSNMPPVKIVLKFSDSVAYRVKETRWHSSEKICPLKEGGLLWEGRIAEPKEMIPWIRGWGKDVEVLEPLSLRRQIIEELADWRNVYGQDQ